MPAPFSIQTQSLIVFSDDWGRHPSSCQHLVRHLLADVQVSWINTIGMRNPRIDLATFRRGLQKFGGWATRRSAGVSVAADEPTNPRVISPVMWPRFQWNWEQAFNARLLRRSLLSTVASSETVVLTTVPIVADVVGKIPAKRWIYYRVDDFSQWPGHDAQTLERMERRLIQRVDQIVAAGDNLAAPVAQMGRDVEVISHGVDVDFWKSAPDEAPAPEFAGLEAPLILFWGLIDQRLDVDTVGKLAHSLKQGTLVLVGPEQDAPQELDQLPRVVRLGAVPLERLPRLAAHATVLMMPYADLAVTRAMQPLKLKEYLATGKPVVVNNLPAVQAWRDCLDVASTSQQFVDLVHANLASGVRREQLAARSRLQQESWAAKAARLREVLFQENG